MEHTLREKVRSEGVRQAVRMAGRLAGTYSEAVYP